MPYFFSKLGKMAQNLSSAAVMIGALLVITYSYTCSVNFEPVNF